MFTKAIYLLLISTAIAQTWNTCKDVPFCNRLRGNSDGQYTIPQNSVQYFPAGIKATLKHNNKDQELDLTITALAESTFRVQVNDPLNPRHTMEDALDGEPVQLPIQMTDLNEYSTTFTANGNRVVLTFKPTWHVSFYHKEEHMVQLNSQRFMSFSSEGDSAISMDAIFRGPSNVYGLPEHADGLAMQQTEIGKRDPYRLFNLDYGYYKVDSQEALYGSVPVVYAHGEDSASAGVFWLNSAQTFVDNILGLNYVRSTFLSESGAIDMFVMTGPTLEDAVRQYSKLTGTAPLPSYFNLGYHQSRYSYLTQDDLETVVSEFDAHDFPLDVIWLDIDYTDVKKYFTWNKTAFPDPLAMQHKLNSTGRKLVLIIDPHIKVEKGYYVSEEGHDGGYFVKNEDGSDFEGECWPGLSNYIDFTSPKALEWYAGLYQRFEDTTDIVNIWNDMNEPSVFSTEHTDEKTIPWNAVHHGGWLHRDIHNAYGFYQTKGTYEGLMKRDGGNTRPFVLTRAHFAGSQRYTAVWTGDNIANWHHLQYSIPMCLTEALAGISFCGADVGGFIENVEEQLFQRWYQVGAWLPFFRAHSTHDTDRREPYLYPEVVQDNIRKSLRQRYHHLPYWYTLFFEHQLTGAPVIRPLSYHYPNERETMKLDQQWLVGSDILVSPVLQRSIDTQRSYFPPGLWLDIERNEMYEGPGYAELSLTLDYTPVFYRGGSIISLKEAPRKNSQETHLDPFTLYVFANRSNQATGRLYIDDYVSQDYKKSKEYFYIEFAYESGGISWKKLHEDANYDANMEIGKTIIYRPGKGYTKATLSDGREAKIEYGPDDFYLSISELNVKLGDAGKIILS